MLKQYQISRATLKKVNGCATIHNCISTAKKESTNKGAINACYEALENRSSNIDWDFSLPNPRL